MPPAVATTMAAAEAAARLLTFAYYRSVVRSLRALENLPSNSSSGGRSGTTSFWHVDGEEEEAEARRSRGAYYSSNAKEQILSEWDVFRRVGGDDGPDPDFFDPIERGRSGTDVSGGPDPDAAMAIEEYRGLLDRGERSRLWIMKKYGVADDPCRGWIGRWRDDAVARGDIVAAELATDIDAGNDGSGGGGRGMA
eukprot:CAMPEP_0194293540 /NCGR_PEP_ID=MMETSP0169-20130528/48150_1 /TAXON_ID=218684 /ORGANISM="Corethron pennatum, Strain L29A3" /LENGTH=194 /DNA_ID=CAMNT_0039042083 /DNA_START=49 /DNA_END=633 /DNA_ORIENTATION=+